MSVENKEGETKLYAGKYKTVEELEEGYKRSLPLYQENETLKKKIDEMGKTPDDYFIPKDVQLSDDEVNDIKSIAKNSGLTQAHFDKLAFDRSEKNKARVNQLEETKKALGAEKLNIINDYVKKHYPDKIADTVVTQMLSNKEMFDAAMRHRDQLLNSTVPGTNKPNSIGYQVTKDDLIKARNAIDEAPYHKRPELERKYINLTREFSHAKKDS